MGDGAPSGSWTREMHCGVRLCVPPNDGAEIRACSTSRVCKHHKVTVRSTKVSGFEESSMEDNSQSAHLTEHGERVRAQIGGGDWGRFGLQGTHTAELTETRVVQ